MNENIVEKKVAEALENDGWCRTFYTRNGNVQPFVVWEHASGKRIEVDLPIETGLSDEVVAAILEVK